MREVDSHYVDATQIITRIDSMILVEFARLLLEQGCGATYRQIND